MSSLLEIANQNRQLIEMLSDPEIDEQMVHDTLEGIKMELDAKAESYVNVINFLEADAAHLEEIINACQLKKQTIQNNVKQMKDTIIYAMEVAGEKELKAGDVTIKVVGNGGKKPLKIDGEVPQTFQKVVYENDNERIRAFLEGLSEGEGVDWAHLENRGKHLKFTY